VRDGRVMYASFWTDSCGPSIASGSMVTEMAERMNISEAQRISQHDVRSCSGWTT
jgi:nitrogen fixation NifU-like protein